MALCENAPFTQAIFISFGSRTDSTEKRTCALTDQQVLSDLFVLVWDVGAPTPSALRIRAQEAQKPVKTSLHLNLAACGVKAGMWVSVVDNCEEALRLQPGHTKALLRRGKAHVGLEMWRDAQLDFEAVLATEGSAEIPDAKRELARLKQKMRQQDQKERGAFQGLFDKIRVAEAEPQEPAAAEPPQAEAPVSCCSAGTCGGTK